MCVWESERSTETGIVCVCVCFNDSTFFSRKIAVP